MGARSTVHHKLNTQTSTLLTQAVASACGISAMPTFQVFKNGAKVEELVGASKDRLKALIQKYA
jgi:thioredoxin-like negative regulator of GroEL